MQLFLRAQNTHTLEVTGTETVRDIKVRLLSSCDVPITSTVASSAGSPEHCLLFLHAIV